MTTDDVSSERAADEPDAKSALPQSSSRPSSSPQSPPSPSAPQAASTWSFVKWSAITLACVVILGVIVARLLHELGIE